LVWILTLGGQLLCPTAVNQRGSVDCFGFMTSKTLCNILVKDRQRCSLIIKGAHRIVCYCTSNHTIRKIKADISNALKGSMDGRPLSSLSTSVSNVSNSFEQLYSTRLAPAFRNASLRIEGYFQLKKGDKLKESIDNLQNYVFNQLHFRIIEKSEILEFLEAFVLVIRKSSQELNSFSDFYNVSQLLKLLQNSLLNNRKMSKNYLETPSGIYLMQEYYEPNSLKLSKKFLLETQVEKLDELFNCAKKENCPYVKGYLALKLLKELFESFQDDCRVNQQYQTVYCLNFR